MLAGLDKSWVGFDCARRLTRRVTLPAGQLPDTPLLEPGEVHQRQHFPRFGFTLCAWHSRQLQAEGNVGQDLLPRQQGIVLKHHAALGTRAFDGNAIKGNAPGANLGGDQKGFDR